MLKFGECNFKNISPWGIGVCYYYTFSSRLLNLHLVSDFSVVIASLTLHVWTKTESEREKKRSKINMIIKSFWQMNEFVVHNRYTCERGCWLLFTSAVEILFFNLFAYCPFLYIRPIIFEKKNQFSNFFLIVNCQ